jgi:hypothetical protein
MGWKVSKTHIMAMITMEPTMTQRMGTSPSIRLEAVDSPAPSARTSFKPARSAEMMVGKVRSRVISPAAATAPAPMGRMYEPQIWSGVIWAMGIVDG